MITIVHNHAPAEIPLTRRTCDRRIAVRLASSMRTTTVLLFSLLSLAACDTTASTSEAKPTPAADKSAQPEPATAPVTMIEHDLSTEKGWEGWKANGPDYAKVMSELHQGVRIAGGGSRLDKVKKEKFDLAFYPTTQDTAPLKASLNTGLEKLPADAKAKLTVTTDTPELLEWTFESHGQTNHHFLWNFEAGGKAVACRTALSGLGSAAAIATHKAACKTLTKA